MSHNNKYNKTALHSNISANPSKITTEEKNAILLRKFYV